MKHWVTALAAASVLPAAAAAQDAPGTGPIDRPTSVAERSRPDYQPIGGRLGSFFLFPSVSTGVVATDNVFASQENKEADVYGNILADARLVSIFSRHQLNFRAFVDQTLHARFGRENRTEFGVQAGGRLDYSRDFAISAAVLAERGAEERTSFNNIASARSPVRFNRLTMDLAADYASDRAVFGSALRFNHRDYLEAVTVGGAPLPQDYRDMSTGEVTGYGGLAVRPGVAAILRATADSRRYTLPLDDPQQPQPPVDRDSRGYRLEGGLRFDVGEVLYGEARAGYFSRDYADATLLDPSGLALGVDLLYNISRLTSLRVSADRFIDESSSPTIAGNRLTSFGASVEREIRRNLIATLLGRYQKINPIGPEEDSDQMLVQGSASYLANRRLRFTGEYRFEARSSPQASREFSEHRLTVAAILRL